MVRQLSPRAPFLYRCAVRLVRAALPVLGLFSATLRRSQRQRRVSLGRFLEWRGRNTAVPLVLFHAASAGELRQVEPVLRRLRAGHADWQFAATSFSPSGLPVLERLPLDLSGLLPLDLPDELSAFLDAIRPDAIVFSKHDVWPGLAALAAGRNIRLGLIAGTVRPGSGRLKAAARSVLGPGYRSLSQVAAVAAEDAERLERLGVLRERIEILGDPRVDAVLDQVGPRQAAPNSKLLVAGSTWPADEAVLLPAFALVRQHRPEARLLLVPHRPGPDAERRIRALARKYTLPAPSPEPGGDAPLVLLNGIGQLQDAYGLGAMVYVGGGFGTAGLHSVLEPAGWGLPIMTGPHWRESRDAVALRSAGALFTLEGNSPGAALAELWLRWLDRDEERKAAGASARRQLEETAGAADRTAALVVQLVQAARTGR